MTLVKRQNRNFKVQIRSSEIKSEKARFGKHLSHRRYSHCPPHKHPLEFLQCSLNKGPPPTGLNLASRVRKDTEHLQIGSTWVMT